MDRHQEHNKRSRRKLKDIERRFSCNVLGCSRPYASEQSLKQHKKRKHSFFGLAENEGSVGGRTNAKYNIGVRPAKCLIRKRTISCSASDSVVGSSPRAGITSFDANHGLNPNAILSSPKGYAVAMDSGCSTDNTTNFPMADIATNPSKSSINAQGMQPQLISLESMPTNSTSGEASPPPSAKSCTSSSSMGSKIGEGELKSSSIQENIFLGSAISSMSRSNSQDSLPGVVTSEKYRKLMNILQGMDEAKIPPRYEVFDNSPLAMANKFTSDGNLKSTVPTQVRLCRKAERAKLASQVTMPEIFTTSDNGSHLTIPKSEELAPQIAKTADSTECMLGTEFSASLKIQSESPILAPQRQAKRPPTNELDQTALNAPRESQTTEQLQRASRCLQRELLQQQQLIQALLRHQQQQISQQQLLHSNLECQEKCKLTDTTQAISRADQQGIFPSILSATPSTILSNQPTSSSVSEMNLPLKVDSMVNAGASSIAPLDANPGFGDTNFTNGLSAPLIDSVSRRQTLTTENARSPTPLFDIEALMNDAYDINLTDSARLADDLELYDGADMVNWSLSNETTSSSLNSRSDEPQPLPTVSSGPSSDLLVNPATRTMRRTVTAPTLGQSIETNVPRICKSGGLLSPRLLQRSLSGSNHLAMLDRCMSFVEGDTEHSKLNFGDTSQMDYSNFNGA